MAEKILTSLDLAQLETHSKLFASKGKTNLGFELSRLGLRSKSEVFSRIKESNQVRKHLEDSVTTRLKKSFGEVVGVRFNYNWYGLFFNTGANNAFGKGVNLPALQWQAAALNPEIEIFFTKITNFYGDLAIKNIEFKNKK